MTQLRPDLRGPQSDRAAQEKKKGGSSLIPICVALIVILGPVALFILIPAVIIYVIFKLVSGGKKMGLTGTHPADRGTEYQDRYDGFDQSRYERPAVDFDRDDVDEDDLELDLDLDLDLDEDDREYQYARSAPHEFGSHIHMTNNDHSRESRLKQLEVLKKAGLYTDAEYRQAKERIIRETEP